MGISIHYEGNLNESATIDGLVSFVRAQCVQLGWGCDDVREPISGFCVRIFATEENTRREGPIEDELRGIWVHPPGTETLYLTFDSAGKLTRFLELSRDMVRFPNNQDHVFAEMGVWVKTTGAIDSHAKIVTLLRLVKDRFVGDLKVDDDTGYWDCGSLRELQLSHGMMGSFLDLFNDTGFVREVLRQGGQKLPKEARMKRLDPVVKARRPRQNTPADRSVN